MLTKVANKMRRFVRNDEGLETVEYAIITGLIVAATIVVIAAIGVWAILIAVGYRVWLQRRSDA